MPKIGLSIFLQSKISFLTFSILPLKLSFLYLIILGWVYYNLLNRKGRQKIQRNLSLVFQDSLSLSQLQRLTKKTITNTFIHYAEKLFQASCSYNKAAKFISNRVRLNGLGRLEEALADGKGTLIVTGHFGAVEFLPSSLALRGLPLMIMAKFKTDKLRDLSLARASRAGFSILDCQKHPQPLLASIKHLKEGKALVIECDETESWHPHRDKRGQFLGCSILVDKTIDLMVKRTNCSVFTAFVHRNGNRQYQLDLKKIDHAIDGKGIGELSMKALEEYIYANPEQWYLWNRFDEMLVDYGATECESTELSSTILGSLFAYK